jgi:hypothetical protein
MNSSTFFTDNHLAFNHQVEEYLNSCKNVWSKKYVNGELLNGLLHLASYKLNHVALPLQAKSLKNLQAVLTSNTDLITVNNHLIGYYKSIKKTQQNQPVTYSPNKLYSINMKNNSDEKGIHHALNIARELLEHLKWLFEPNYYNQEIHGRLNSQSPNVKMPEYIFLLDSVYTSSIQTIYFEAGFSSVFIADAVKSNQLPTGTTILTRKVVDDNFISSIKIVPYSFGFTNYQDFDPKQHSNIVLHSAVFVPNINCNYVGAFHQPAADTQRQKAYENICQIKAMEAEGCHVDALLMDSNKYGVDSLSYQKSFRVFKKILFNHPVAYFLPAVIKGLRKEVVNGEEIHNSAVELYKELPNYRIFLPLDKDGFNLAKTYHGEYSNLPHKTFANIAHYCLDMAICDNNKNWGIEAIYPQNPNSKNPFTDHSGILVFQY